MQCDLRAQERRFGEDHVVHRDVRRREKSPLPMKRAGSAMRAFRGPHLLQSLPRTTTSTVTMDPMDRLPIELITQV